MKMIIVWVLSLNAPNTEDYIFYTNFFNSEADCMAVVSKVVVEKPFELACAPAATWVPSKTK